MKRMIFLILLAASVLLASPAAAQQPVQFDLVQVQFWPEYDRSEMLVIHTLQLSAQTALPVEITLRIPAAAGEPTAVAVADGNNLVNTEYTYTVVGNWAEVTVVADSDLVQVEYYDPALSQGDPLRQYAYTWNSGYAVNQFVLRVQQPVGAMQMAFNPDLGQGQIESDGLTYYTAAFSDITAGQEITLSMSYTKNDTALTAESLTPQQPATTAPTETSTLLSNLPPLAWVVLGVGVVLIGVGVWYFQRSGTQPQPSSYRQKKQRSAVAGSAKMVNVFCHSCGTQAVAGDKYCRECGTKLRV